jgi:hypothetical protein
MGESGVKLAASVIGRLAASASLQLITPVIARQSERVEQMSPYSAGALSHITRFLHSLQLLTISKFNRNYRQILFAAALFMSRTHRHVVALLRSAAAPSIRGLVL